MSPDWLVGAVADGAVFDGLLTRHDTAQTNAQPIDFLASSRVTERVDDDPTLLVAAYDDSPCQPNER